MNVTIEQAIAEAKGKIQGLTELIEKLEWFKREFPITAFEGLRRIAKPRRKAARRQVQKAKPGTRSSAILEDGITTRIIEALVMKSPRSPRELVKFAKADKLAVRRRLKQLEASGRITLTGATASREIHLGKAKASPAPDLARGARLRQVGANALERAVELLDDKVHVALIDAGRTGRTIRELKISHSDKTDEQLERSLTRLKIRGKAVVDEGGRWTPV